MGEKGDLDYSVYMMSVIGCMVEARKALVRKVKIICPIALKKTNIP